MPKVSREGWMSKANVKEWRHSGIPPYLCSEAQRHRCVRGHRVGPSVLCPGCHRVRVTVEDLKEDK